MTYTPIQQSDWSEYYNQGTISMIECSTCSVLHCSYEIGVKVAHTNLVYCIYVHQHKSLIHMTIHYYWCTVHISMLLVLVVIL